MYKLYIDSQLIEGLSGLGVELSYDGSKASDPTAEGERNIEILIPSSFQVDEILSWSREINPGERFHDEEHTARLLYADECIIEGRARIVEVVRGEEISYLLRITTPAPAWQTIASDSAIAEIGVSYEAQLNMSAIEESWTSSSGVRFFPVHRDDYESEWSKASNENVRRINTIDDYHPFLNIRKIIAKLATKAGYTVVSDVMASDEFATLYMSGEYDSTQGDVAKEKMDFYVKRGSDGEATVDNTGRIYITGAVVGSSSVGYMVSDDTLTSDNECYSYGNCFSCSSGVPTFTPLGSVSVGFIYRFHYTTGYRIESRTLLSGISNFYLGYGDEISVDLVNNFADVRDELRGSYQYRLVVFDHVSGRKYRVCDSSIKLIDTIEARSGLFTTPETMTSSAILIYGDDNGWYGSYLGDWAIYNGYVEEEGEMEVDLTIRSAPQTASPTSPVTFSFIYGSGANPETSFTLHSDSSISPFFAGYPGYGSTIKYGDVAQQGITVMNLISSLAHIYNLRFYSDTARSRLYVDSYDDIPSAHGQWDWSEKQVESEGITLYDRALGEYSSQSRGYQEHDGYTLRMDDLEADEIFGRGEWSIDSSATESGVHTELNPIFSPSMCDDDGVLIVGDRDDLELVDTYDFSTRVAFQVEESDGESTPRLAFHSADDGVSLCFEDRDGLTGLISRYYGGEAEHISQGRVATLSLKLEPYEVVELLSPRDDAASVWSLFTLRISGSMVTARLLSFEGYNPEVGVAKCKFLIIE